MVLGNPSSILKNTEIDIIRRVSVRDPKTGSKNETETTIYEDVDAKIEPSKSENPLKIFGIELTTWSLIHVWTDESGEVYQMRVGDIILDRNTSKKYKVIELLTAKLSQMPVHHLEAIAIVYGDKRFDNFILNA